MKLAVLFAVLFTGLCFAADAKEDAVKKEMEKLQGTWKVVKAVKEGKAASDEKLKKLQAVIAGDKLTLTEDGTRIEITFTIDPGKKPATIDLTLVQAERTIKGIYELDKDTLKICTGQDEGSKRPTEFKSTEEAGTSLMVFSARRSSAAEDGRVEGTHGN